jgi:hypothetical protein
METEETTKKGCVYFFKHSTLDPIKIGYSNDNSPLKRFDTFKTYAPFGGEIIGFIITADALSVERKLHIKYASKRLEGEWFEITKEDVENEINFYSAKEDIRLKNEFQIEWARKIENEKIDYSDFYKSETNYDNFVFLYNKRKIKNPKILSKKLNVSLQMIYKYKKKYNKK